MLKARVIVCLTFLDGVLHRTKKFKADYRYTDHYVAGGADEIFCINLGGIGFQATVGKIADQTFAPFCVGGEIATVEGVKQLLRLGADKTVINTAAVERPELITEVAKKFGSQCMVLGIDVGRDGYVWTHHGTKTTHRNPVDWAREGAERGAGEIFLQSIERDGSLQGYDIDLLERVAGSVDVPVVVGSGAGAWPHFVAGVRAGATGVATNNVFHFTAEAIAKAKSYMNSHGVPVR